MKKIILIFIGAMIVCASLSAQEVSKAVKSKKENFDKAQIIAISMKKQKNNTWTISTTVRHNDEGWNHYADRWYGVNDKTDEVMFERILAHPHDNEQPFTRSLSGIMLPKNTKFIMYAQCNKHKAGKGIPIHITPTMTKFVYP